MGGTKKHSYLSVRFAKVQLRYKPMMLSNTLFQRYPTQLALLLSLTGLCFMVSGASMFFLGQFIFHTSMDQLANQMMKPENANMSRLLNTAFSIISFGLPPILYAKLLGSQPFRRLGFNAHINGQQVGWVVLILIASIGLTGMLSELNQSIPLPKEWQMKAKAMEENYERTVMAMAHMPRLIDFILAILTVALAPAILEELMFRSALQPIFIGITRNPFWGIFITSLLFSAIHFEVYGFIPRLALGFLLGLVYYYGKNIWLSIMFHFLNNAMIVVALFWADRNGISTKEVINQKIPLLAGMISVVALFLMLRFFIGASRRYWEQIPSLFKLNHQPDA